MKRKMVAAIALTAVVLIQLTVVNGLALPGGGTPDLVLLCVIALGMTAGPVSGLIAGFCAGLALDLAPPATALVGQYALVLCLAGYCAGRLRFTLRHSPLLALAAAAVVAMLGEFIAAALGLALDGSEVSWAAIAHELPPAVLYDVVLSPLLLFCSVRLAMALGISLERTGDSPARESGGSAAPVSVARLAKAGSGNSSAAASRWLLGDVAEAEPSMGAVGWLGPARSRRARRKQARLTAMLTGANPRRGAFWVGRQPPGLRPGKPARAPKAASAPVRLRPGSGVPGSAAVAVRWVPGTGPHGLDRHGLTGRVPKIAFGTGSLPRTGEAAWQPVPRIAFGSARAGSAAVTGNRPAPRIAFGTGGLQGAGRAAGRRVPRIAFGTGSLPGAARSAGRAVPRIKFGRWGPGLLTGRQTYARPQPRRAAPHFRSPAPARSAAKPWLAGGAVARGTVALSAASAGPLSAPGDGSVRAGSLSLGPFGTGYRGIAVIRPGRRRKQPRFTRVVASQQPARARRPKTPRIGGRRGVFRRLRWVTWAGDRSTVWHIGSRRTEGWR